MVRAARALLPLYPEVDPDLAIAGIILHDMGKLEEYEGEFAAKVSRIGTLQGHVVIGFRIARKAAILSKLNADLTEPSIGEDYVETGAFGTRVPAWDLLFVLGALPDIAQPPTERITDVIVPLPYTTTDVALGRVISSSMPRTTPQMVRLPRAC